MVPLLDVYENIRSRYSEDEELGEQTSEKYLEVAFEQSRNVDWDEVFCEDRSEVTEDACSKLRDAGTKFFQKNNIVEAVGLYNNYIRMCHSLPEKTTTPDQKRHLIYQGYANRSAALFRGQHFSKCIQDIEAALSYSNEEAKKEYLLLDRWGKCCSSLGQIETSEKKFALALVKVALVNDIPEQLKSAFTNQVEASLKKLKENPGNIEVVKATSKVTSDSPCSNHVSLSSKTQVMFNDTQGRYVVAAEDIVPGEVIAVESPNASFAHYDRDKDMSKVCHHCLKSFDTDLMVTYPSQHVDGIMFCSFQCLQEADQTYHSHERFIWKDYIDRTREKQEDLERSGCLFLAFRSVTRKPAHFFESALTTFLKEDPTFGVNKKINVDIDAEQAKFMSLYNLVRHESLIPGEEKVRAAIRSVIFIESLKRTHYFSAQCNLDKLEGTIKMVMVLLYRLQLGITFNVHLIYQVSGSLSGDIPLKMVGSGVYENLVLLNHSCAPNTTRFYQNGNMIVVAKKMIRKGEEICNNYGMHHNNQTTEQRKTNLLKNYKFDCRCEACTRDYPLLADLNSRLPSKLNKQLESLLSQYQRHFKANEIDEARIACSKYLTKLDQGEIKYPHRNYEIGAIALNSCWWAMIASHN